MKKKGFTLIELLAVIVVLAIIALIATPIVMNVIKNAQMGAAERSADNYVKAVETLIATKQLDGEKMADGIYTITSEGKLKSDDKEYEVEVSGTKPNGGTIKIENGQVVKNASSISVGDYTVTYKDGVAEAKELAKLLDVCSFLENDTHNEGRNPNTVGAKYTCDLGAGASNFYVLEAGTSSKPATLILEGNYDTETLGWCAFGAGNSCAADGLTAKLDEIASVWTKLDRSQIGIPSASQIAVADSQSFNGQYFQVNNEWLYDDPSIEGYTEGTGPVHGYWTSTPLADDSFSAWYVSESGYMSNTYAEYNYAYGLRPVITLSI